MKMNSLRSYGILCTATTDPAVSHNRSDVDLPSHHRADFARSTFDLDRWFWRAQQSMWHGHSCPSPSTLLSISILILEREAHGFHSQPSFAKAPSEAEGEAEGC